MTDTILKQIRKYMKDSGISYEKLGAKLGISRQQLNVTLIGVHGREPNPKMRTIEKICEALGLSIILLDNN